MKKIVLTLFIFLMTLIVIQSCRKEENLNLKDDNFSRKELLLKKRIPNSFSYGKSYTVTFDSKKITIQEIITSNSNFIYYTISTKNNVELIAFIEMDINNNIITLDDFVENKEYINSTFLNKELSKFKYDYIEMIKVSVQSKRFWGRSCGEYDSGYMYCCYYRFWIPFNCGWEEV